MAGAGTRGRIVNEQRNHPRNPGDSASFRKASCSRSATCRAPVEPLCSSTQTGWPILCGRKGWGHDDRTDEPLPKNRLSPLDRPVPVPVHRPDRAIAEVVLAARLDAQHLEVAWAAHVLWTSGSDDFDVGTVRRFLHPSVPLSLRPFLPPVSTCRLLDVSTFGRFLHPSAFILHPFPHPLRPFRLDFWMFRRLLRIPHSEFSIPHWAFQVIAQSRARRRSPPRVIMPDGRPPGPPRL